MKLVYGLIVIFSISCAGADRYMAAGNQRYGSGDAGGNNGIQGSDDDGGFGSGDGMGDPVGGGGIGDGIGGGMDNPGQGSDNPGQNGGSDIPGDNSEDNKNPERDPKEERLCRGKEVTGPLLVRVFETDEIDKTFDFDDFNLEGFKPYDKGLDNLKAISEFYCEEDVSFENVAKDQTEFKTNGKHDHYYVKILGAIEFPEAGDWQFAVKSNEGVRLKVDGILLLNDENAGGGFDMVDNLLPSKYQEREYALEIDFFKASAGKVGLELYWKRRVTLSLS